MSKDLELWQFIASRLKNGEAVMLLIVAASAGSSPGRAGYGMAVAEDGELIGSIGGGVMEVRLVEIAKSQIQNLKFEIGSELVEQVHRKDNTNSSGMICSGKQTVIFKQLGTNDLVTVESILHALENREAKYLSISTTEFAAGPPKRCAPTKHFHFEKMSETDFFYEEKLGPKNDLYIVGGGHCSLALSQLMSRMDFTVRIFDDRPELNTIEKNRFADEITIIDSYERIGELIIDGPNAYVVVMTLGFRSDEVVISALLDKAFKYFGVLGSRAKMKTLLTSFATEGVSEEKLGRIRTPIGLPINSHTPEEIAISIAAEIIAVKNQD